MKAVDDDRVMLDVIPYAIHCMISCRFTVGFVDQAVGSIKQASNRPRIYGRDEWKTLEHKRAASSWLL